jgi:glycosyltransferase involved in cell wall biosynthesis
MIDAGLDDDDLLGIVVPFYSDSYYLIQLLESIANQSCSAFEVLIVDDSRDQSLRKCLGEMNPDISYSILENGINLGPFATWNRGLQEMFQKQKHCLISIVHEDDLLHRDYVKNALLCYSKHRDVDVFHSKVKIIGKESRLKFSFQDSYKSLANFGVLGKPIRSVGDTGLASILKNNFVFCPSMMFNVNKFDVVEFDTRWQMVSDLEFISKALLEGRSLLQLPEKIYFYRRHNNNLTAKLTNTTKRFEEELQLFREIEVRCREAGFQKSAEVAKKARIIKLHIAYRMLLALIRLDFGGIRRLMSVLLLNKN